MQIQNNRLYTEFSLDRFSKTITNKKMSHKQSLDLHEFELYEKLFSLQWKKRQDFISRMKFLTSAPACLAWTEEICQRLFTAAVKVWNNQFEF